MVFCRTLHGGTSPDDSDNDNDNDDNDDTNTIIIVIIIIIIIICMCIYVYIYIYMYLWTLIIILLLLLLLLSYGYATTVLLLLIIEIIIRTISLIMTSLTILLWTSLEYYGLSTIRTIIYIYTYYSSPAASRDNFETKVVISECKKIKKNINMRCDTHNNIHTLPVAIFCSRFKASTRGAPFSSDGTLLWVWPLCNSETLCKGEPLGNWLWDEKHDAIVWGWEGLSAIKSPSPGTWCRKPSCLGPLQLRWDPHQHKVQGHSCAAYAGRHESEEGGQGDIRVLGPGRVRTKARSFRQGCHFLYPSRPCSAGAWKGCMVTV